MGCSEVARYWHFEQAKDVGDVVALRGVPAIHPNAEEKQRIDKSRGLEDEVVDNEHGEHGEEYSPSVVRGGFESFFQWRAEV